MNVPPGSYGSSITIEEVTGSRKWSVTLAGAGLPHQGAGWETDHRSPTEFYPGNFTQGTQQVIGPKEGPSHWTGIWRRTMLLRSPATITPGGQPTQTATPSTLADFLEELLLGGARLRVTWTQTKNEYVGTTQSGPFTYQKVREGRPSHHGFFPLTGDDIKWDITWSWVSRGGTQQKAVSTRDGDSSSNAAQVQSSLTDAIALTGTLSPQSATNPLLPLSATPLTLGQLETLDASFLSLSFGFNASLISLQAGFGVTADVGLSSSTDTGQVNNSVLSLSVDTIGTCNDFVDAVGQMPVETMSQSDYAGDQAYAALAAAQQVLQAWGVRDAAQKAATKARILASTNPGGGQKGRQQTSSTGPGQILAVYRTRDGDTPQALAMFFYQNADKAKSIMAANHLPLGQPSFPTGTLLMIPVLRSSSTSS